MNDDLELEVFRAGDYGPKGAWPEAAISQIAEDYDPALHEAPVTLDHAQEGPALGWVASVRRNGDRLMARLKGLNRRLVELLRDGSFKKRSVELYGRLPETGKPYLKAVSFLGAAAPAVKGLQDPVFAEGSRAVDFRDGFGGHESFELGDEASGVGSADGVASTEVSDEAPEIAAAGTLPRLEAPPARDLFNPIEVRLRDSGRWIPAWEERGIREFFAALSALDEIEAAPGQAISPAEWFAEFLAALPAYVPMGESAPTSAGLRFAETFPGGASLSPASVDLHRRALAIQASKPGTGYAQALLECARQ